MTYREEWNDLQFLRRYTNQYYDLLRTYANQYYTLKATDDNKIGFCKWVFSNKIQSLKRRLAVKETARAKRLAEGSNKFHRLNGEIKEMKKTIIESQEIITTIDEIILEAKQNRKQ